MEAKDVLLLLAGALISFVINYITIYISVPLANKFGQWRDRRAQLKAMKSVEEAKARIQSLEGEFFLRGKDLLRKPRYLYAYGIY